MLCHTKILFSVIIIVLIKHYVNVYVTIGTIYTNYTIFSYIHYYIMFLSHKVNSLSHIQICRPHTKFCTVKKPLYKNFNLYYIPIYSITLAYTRLGTGFARDCTPNGALALTNECGKE